MNVDPTAIAVAIMALVGAIAGVLVQHQRTTSESRAAVEKNAADERIAYLASLVSEIKGLRAAEDFNDTRITDIMARLQQAQLDILQCYKERNELSIQINQLEAQIKELRGTK